MNADSDPDWLIAESSPVGVIDGDVPEIAMAASRAAPGPVGKSA